MKNKQYYEECQAELRKLNLDEDRKKFTHDCRITPGQRELEGLTLCAILDQTPDIDFGRFRHLAPQGGVKHVFIALDAYREKIIDGLTMGIFFHSWVFDRLATSMKFYKEKKVAEKAEMLQLLQKMEDTNQALTLEKSRLEEKVKDLERKREARAPANSSNLNVNHVLLEKEDWQEKLKLHKKTETDLKDALNKILNVNADHLRLEATVAQLQKQLKDSKHIERADEPGPSVPKDANARWKNQASLELIVSGIDGQVDLENKTIKDRIVACALSGAVDLTEVLFARQVGPDREKKLLLLRFKTNQSREAAYRAFGRDRKQVEWGTLSTRRGSTLQQREQRRSQWRAQGVQASAVFGLPFAPPQQSHIAPPQPYFARPQPYCAPPHVQPYPVYMNPGPWPAQPRPQQYAHGPQGFEAHRGGPWAHRHAPLGANGASGLHE